VQIKRNAKRWSILPWHTCACRRFPRLHRVLQLAHDENVQLQPTVRTDFIGSGICERSADVGEFGFVFSALSIEQHLQAIAVLGANTLQGMCITVGARAYLGKSMSHPSMRACGP